MKLHRFIPAAASLVILGCDSPTPTDAADFSPRIAMSRGVVSSTSGSGQAQLPAGFTLMDFEFNAKLSEDGSAKGEFYEHYESAGGIVDFRGVVTCVSFDAANGRAWVGGVVTHNNSTHPNMLTAIHEVGRDVWFRVVDEGEGNSAADRTTVYGFTGAVGITTSAQYCDTQPWAANNANTWEAVSGNIQVRP